MKNKIKLPMRTGDFVDLRTNGGDHRADGKGVRIAHFVVNVEEHGFDNPYPSGLRMIEPCGMYVELTELEKRFRKDGNIYELMSEFKQHVNVNPLSQEKFDEEMAKVDGVATVFELVQGTLPDGYWFILEYCGGQPRNKEEAREIRAFGVSANFPLKKLYELDQSFTLADTRMLEWLFAIRDCAAWVDELDDLEIDDKEDREWLLSLILSLEAMYRDYTNNCPAYYRSREDFAYAVSCRIVDDELDLSDIEKNPTPVYQHLKPLK